MAFQFRMVFAGLSVLVPDREFTDSIQPADSAVMLLMDLSQSRTLSDGLTFDAHHPLLKFNLAQRRSTSTRRTDLQNPTHGICLLHTEEIEILPIPRLATSFKMLTHKPASLENPTEEDKRSLFWLATMEQATGGRGRLQRGLVDGPLGMPIRARVLLDRGRLVTEQLSERVCRFQPPGTNGFERRIASSLALEIDRVPDQVVLSLTRRGGKPQTLVLAPENGEQVVTVEIQNREADEFFQLAPPEITPERSLADFEVFFELMEDRRQPLRFLHQDPSNESPFDPPHAICPPTGANQSTSGGSQPGSPGSQ